MRLLWIVLLASVSTSALSAGADDAADRRKGWFNPTLVANHSAQCASFRDRVSTLFYSTDTLEQLPRDFSLSQLEAVTFSTPFVEISLHGKPAYLVNRTLGGCGGACETRQLHASPEPPPTGGSEWWEFLRKLPDAPPAAPEYLVFRTDAGEYFVAMIAANKAQLHRLNAGLRWSLECAVQVAPEDLSATSDRRVQLALNAIIEIERATAAVRGGAGSCGSLASHHREGSYLSRALRFAIYRPWVLSEALPWSRGQPYEAYLQEWALRGISEFNAYRAFQTQRTHTARAIATFFGEEFDWSNERATAAAAQALDVALDAGFSFATEFSFFSASEGPLRRALLEQHSLAAIQQLNLAPDAQVSDLYDAHYYESVLAVAVDYPQALEWLLQRGLDADQANAFGKTPLMHAAQRNSVAAARLLLDHGADPNATTVWPEDTCFYTLSRANVTPLHYAVRYGSRELIELLVERGASTFVGSTEDVAATRRLMPLDWLETYTARDAVERNPHLTESDVVALRDLLRVPQTQELAKIAANLTAAAEGAYAKGSPGEAYRLLKQALFADPASERALTNMSLVAVRAQRPGEALAAATTLIAQTSDPRTLAPAWFNVGLACESAASRHMHYNGAHYCTYSPIHPFLQAWLAEPSAARKVKLESVLTAPGSRLCDARSNGADYVYLITRGDDVAKRIGAGNSLIYVRHSLDTPASGIEISWRSPAHSDGFAPKLLATHVIGSFQLSLLKAETWPPETVHVNGLLCRCDKEGCQVGRPLDMLIRRVEEQIAR